MAIRMQQRRGTAEQWTSANPVLAPGEIGFETDTSQFKIGDGANQWDDLSYFLDTDGLGEQLEDYVAIEEKGEPNGVATLDATGQVPAEQLGNATVDLSDYATEEYVGTAITNLIASAPEALDTLNELAAALGDDENFATTVTNALADKADTEHTHGLADLTDFDVDTPVENQVLKFDGTSWVNAAAGGGIQSSETPPTDTEAFPLWFNTTEGRSYIYYDGFWVELTPSIAGADGTDGIDGVDGEPGVVTATTPLTYDAETQTVAIDQSEIEIEESQVTGLSTSLSSKVEKTNGTVTTASTSSSVVRNITLSTSEPTGGIDGDVWLVYEA